MGIYSLDEQLEKRLQDGSPEGKDGRHGAAGGDDEESHIISFNGRKVKK